MSIYINQPATSSSGLPVSQPFVLGTSGDLFGIIYSSELIGGYQEVATMDELNAIPTAYDPSTYNPFINPDNFSSGRRRIGMTVFVAENQTSYRLVPFGYFGNGGSLGISDWFSAPIEQKNLALDPRNVYATTDGSYNTIGPITGTTSSHTTIMGNLFGTIPNASLYSGVTVSPWVKITSTDTYVVSGSVVSGTTLLNLVQNDGTTGLTIDLSTAISNGYQSLTGASVNTTGTTVSFTGHNTTGTTLDLTSIVNNVYQAFTGATLSGTTILFSGHGINGSVNILSAITGNSTSVTGATITGTSTLNILQSNGVVSLDISPAINNVYQAFTGVTTAGSMINFTGHNATGSTDLTSVVNSIYRAVTGATLSGATLILQSYNNPNITLDFTSVINTTYSGYTGSTYDTTGKTLNLFGHNIPDQHYSLSGLTGGVLSGSTTIPPTGGTATGMTLTLNNSDTTTTNIELANALTFTNPNPTKVAIGLIPSGSTLFASGLTFQQIIQKIFYPTLPPTITYWLTNPSPLSMVATGSTPPQYATIGNLYSFGLKLTAGTRGQSTATPQPVKNQGLITGMTISTTGGTLSSGGSGGGSGTIISALISSYTVTQGLNTWYGNGGYNTGDTPVYDDGTSYPTPSFSNSNTFPQQQYQIEGVYPIYYSASGTTPGVSAATAWPNVSMLTTSQVTDINIAGYDGTPGHEPYIDIPTSFTKHTISTLFIKVGGTYATSSSLTEYLPTGSTTYTINGTSVPYTRYKYSLGVLGGARTIQINLV